MAEHDDDSAALLAELDQTKAALDEERRMNEGAPKVTAHVPPKRAVVNEGHEVVYAGKKYEAGDEILHGEGPVLDDFAMLGVVTILSHDEAKAWNGREGTSLRKATGAPKWSEEEPG